MIKAKRKSSPRGFQFPDPIEHEQHISWLRAKSQEKYLGRDWQITLEEYMQIWGRDLWAKRGRKTNDLAMTRKDWDKPWTKDNVEIITRGEQIQQSNRKHYARRQQSKSIR